MLQLQTLPSPETHYVRFCYAALTAVKYSGEHKGHLKEV